MFEHLEGKERPARFQSLAGRRVLITGNTGLKGSWLSLWLASLGAKVHGYAFRPPTDPSNFEVSHVEECMERQTYADVLDAERLTEVIRELEPDVVMHLAAQSVVREGYKSPRETFETNVMGTVNVLDAIRIVGRPVAVLAITSDKCYENKEQAWGYRECDAMGDHDPYGGSKGAAELVIRSYRDSFFPTDRIADHGVRLASARAGNVIGGGDWTKDALIVDLVRSLIEGNRVEIRSPLAFRPWQHVLQCLSGYLTLVSQLVGGDAPRFCSGWNIGPLPGNEIPVCEVVDAFIHYWGSGAWRDASQPDQPREANVLRLSIDKALWQLDWKPRWTVFEAIRRTAEWFHNYAEDAKDMRQFSLSQIAAYERAMISASREETALERGTPVA